VWDWDVAAPDDCLGVGSIDLTRHLALALARNERVLKKAKALEAEKTSPASAAVIATTAAANSKAKTSSDLSQLTPAQRMKRQAKEAADEAKNAMGEAAKDAQRDAKNLAKKFRKKEAVRW